MEKYDKNLDFATKYNWWTKSQDKSQISLLTKITYILSKGNLEEIVFLFKNFSFDTISNAFDIVKDDNVALNTRRKKVIENILSGKIIL